MSGRRKPPAAPPPAEQLTALAGRLTDDDWQVCRLLADHQVLTTGLLAVLVDASPRTLQQRLTTLTSLRVVDRFRSHQPVGGASVPYHYLLGEAGAAVLAADPSATADRSGGDRARLGGVAHANGRRPSLLAVNTLFAQLTSTAAHRAGTRLGCWWPAGRCQAQWGRLITPDADARWQDPDGEVDFFLHRLPARPRPPTRPCCWRATTSWLRPPASPPRAGVRSDPAQQAQLRDRLTGQRLLVPATRPGAACPSGVADQPSHRRHWLGGLGHPDPWHPTRPAAATPQPRTTRSAGRRPPGCWSRPVEVGPHPTPQPTRRST